MALSLRDDCNAAQLKLAARHSDNADQVRRLLTLAAIYDGASRAQAARTGGVTRQIVRDWVERFNDGGPDALIARKAPGGAAQGSSGAADGMAAEGSSPCSTRHSAQPWRG